MLKKIGSNAYANFDYEALHDQNRGGLKAIILGYAGNGKSSLLNNLHGGQVSEVGFDEESKTKVITMAGTKVTTKAGIKSRLTLFDTPGVVEKSPKGMQQIQYSLEFVRWDLIIIVCKFEARFKITTVTQMMKFLRVFNGHHDKVLVMVSHIDTMNVSDAERDEHIKKFMLCLEEKEIKRAILFSNLEF
jgi:GTPase Era involved in 16S rRNA processing